MPTPDMTAVGAAFEMLLEEIERAVQRAKNLVTTALEQDKHDSAAHYLERSRALTAFREKVASLRKEWNSLSAGHWNQARDGASRRNLGKIRRGMRTQEEAYYLPILQALSENGGSGEIGMILDRVHQLMRTVLKPVDEEPLRSYPKTPRWRNAAQWARNSMVNEGLLRSDSPRGVWEITAKGRKFLERNGGQETG